MGTAARCAVSHPTVELDDTVHQRTRLGILAILSRGDRVEFGYLQEVLGLSAGNLSRHLTTLIEARLVTVDKGYQGRRPRTWISITKTGKNAYDGEMAILRSLLALQDAPRDEDPNASETDDVDQHPDGDREQTSS
ncbi:MAG: hypothetical protein BGO26_19110 [Actinobacteria bacterium 69-20]|nr:MAG: hypothetical protein BGO26_19110 [Actinobacteria bacterium 69-20]